MENHTLTVQEAREINQPNDVGVAEVSKELADTLMDVERAKAVQRVQAQFVIAKKFPRDEAKALVRILDACKRPEIAEIAEYSYPRADKVISDGSIRLAEVLAQAWGNLDYGIIELEHVEGLDGKSIVEAFCMDLETNTRQARTFTIFHKRKVGKGSASTVKHLDDPRDVYEHVANYGARRMRACIFSIIPRYIKDQALTMVRETKRIGDGESLQKRVEKIVVAFGEFAVTADMLEARLKHPLAAISPQELVDLRSIYTSLKDGETKRTDWFDIAAKPQGGLAGELNSRVAKPKRSRKRKAAK